MKVAVLGAGVVGVSTAYFLAQHGHDVTVVDRQPGAGLETSFANGGQISACHADPWAGPATPMKILKWLGRKDAPLLYRFKLDPAQWAWCLRFLANCTGKRNAVNTERILRLALYSREKLRELRDQTDIRYSHLTKGILHVYSDPKEFAGVIPKAEYMSTLGCERQVLTPEECLEVEPALRHSKERITGGTYSPGDESGDAHVYTRELAALAEKAGVRFVYQCTIDHLVTKNARIEHVATDQGPVFADAFVLAAGSYTPLLLRPLGLPLPVYPGKGYSVTIPTDGYDGAPTTAIIDDELKIVYSRLGDKLRVAGTAELTGYDDQVRDARTQPILRAAMTLFPNCGDPEKAEFWAGLRPTTPDSTPVIGETPIENLFLNTGHGTLGWTMAAGTGQVVADIVSGKQPAISVDGLDIKRFL